MSSTPPDQLPPQAVAAEKSVLGSVIRHNFMYDEIALILEPDDFYLNAHQKIYKAASDILGNGKPVDMVILFEALKASGDVEDVGGASYLADLWELAPTAANAVYHAKIVREKATARRAIHLCTELQRDLADNIAPPSELVARFESRIFAVSDGARTDEAVPIGQGMQSLLTKMRNRATTQVEPFIPIGLQELRGLMGGFRPGEFTVLAARPSVGKSALGLRFGIDSALDYGAGVKVFSMEMAAQEWFARVMAGTAEINLNAINNAMNFPPEEWRNMEAAARKYSNVPLWIDDTGSQSINTIAASTRRSVRRDGVGLVIIDYLQLINHQGDRGDTQATKVGNTTRRLKHLARDNKIHIICLAQLNRKSEERADRRPMLSDLRESGEIEQDADNVILLWAETIPGEQLPEIQEIRAIVAKQRNGPTGEAHMEYVRGLTRFQDRLPPM